MKDVSLSNIGEWGWGDGINQCDKIVHRHIVLNKLSYPPTLVAAGWNHRQLY